MSGLLGHHGLLLGGSGGGDPNFANVALLCHMDGANNSTSVVDSSTYGRTITAPGSGSGQATISTTQSKFGGASLALGTAGSAAGAAYVGNPSASLSFGTSDFTIECWLYLASVGGSSEFPAIFYTNGAHAGRFYFAKYPGADQLYVQAPGGSPDELGPFNANLTATAWNHVAWSRTSNVSKIFVGGVQKFSGTDNNNYQAGTSGFEIGHHFGGYEADFIDDLRITVGVGRYTANFTPPTAAFPNS